MLFNCQGGNMSAKREELQTCQYGVPVDYPGPGLDGFDECGKPAIAKWTWDGGEHWLHVCEEHDKKVEFPEGEDEN